MAKFFSKKEIIPNEDLELLTKQNDNKNHCFNCEPCYPACKPSCAPCSPCPPDDVDYDQVKLSNFSKK
jgi:hypothetical protein